MSKSKVSAKKSQARVMIIGAHPDDCEMKCSGVGALWAKRGLTVRFTSATNGQTGHHLIGGIELVRRRAAEAKAAAAALGVESQIFPIPNGGLVPTLEYRNIFIRAIREFAPDVIITHRPYDYHPDHRYTSVLLCDSIYVVTVPNNCPETPALRRMPAVLYMADKFQKPLPSRPEYVISIDKVMEKKITAIAAHESQVFEWLPWNAGIDKVPAGSPARQAGKAERREFVLRRHGAGSADCADRHREKLIERYGAKKGAAVKYAEAFEKSEYGGRLAPELEEQLFGGL